VTDDLLDLYLTTRHGNYLHAVTRFDSRLTVSSGGPTSAVDRD
jgi:hypothetical protein